MSANQTDTPPTGEQEALPLAVPSPVGAAPSLYRAWRVCYRYRTDDHAGEALVIGPSAGQAVATVEPFGIVEAVASVEGEAIVMLPPPPAPELPARVWCAYGTGGVHVAATLEAIADLLHDEERDWFLRFGGSAVRTFWRAAKDDEAGRAAYLTVVEVAPLSAQAR